MNTHLLGWLGWLLAGAVAGGVVTRLRRPTQALSNISYVLVGMVGAFIGGLTFTMFGGQTLLGFNLDSIPIALLGAIGLLGVLLLLDNQSIA
jgi:uncharacterized membrane protein YeaQ/YmgE (transglycosylase-associated protein family)